jgi:hypothetical protein
MNRWAIFKRPYGTRHEIGMAFILADAQLHWKMKARGIASNRL